jgi:hypothetical protein
MGGSSEEHLLLSHQQHKKGRENEDDQRQARAQLKNLPHKEDLRHAAQEEKVSQERRKE